ncbi:MAG: glycoside hydrolase family 88 protein [Lachnospiraceae bacterium]|nr:glycoside hydrolase family 88 protein [Lachnospiraceae bacterium]
MTVNETKDLLNEYTDYLIDDADILHPRWNIEVLNSGKTNKWNYIDGCMISSLIRLYEITGNRKYLDFSDTYMDEFIDEDGSIKTYDPLEYNIDRIKPGCALFTLYDITGKEKYKKAMDLLRSQLSTHPRTREGNFWHKKIYPYQVWLDGLYMAQPFYTEYERRYNGMNGCIDAFRQFENVKRIMRDEKTGLYYHGYDESREMYWADKKTGLSANFWLRATGWYMAALVDTIEAIGEQMYYEYRTLQETLKDLSDSLLKYVDEDTSMFFQVIDKKEVRGNYPETSGSALIAYAFLKGARLKYLPERFGEEGKKIFYGITQKYLSKKEDGTPVLKGICYMAGLGGEKHRDGSVEYYLSEPVVDNDAKGTGPLIMAYVEILSMEKEQMKDRIL